MHVALSAHSLLSVMWNEWYYTSYMMHVALSAHSLQIVGARPFGARSPVGPPSSTDAAPNIRVPDTVAERTICMGKPPETEPACRPEIRAELAAAGCPGEGASFLVILKLRRSRRVWVVIGVRLTAERLTSPTVRSGPAALAGHVPSQQRSWSGLRGGVGAGESQ